MFLIVGFVAACLTLQAIKNAIRGPRKPKVSMAKVQEAQCGCRVVKDQVIVPCFAHKTMLEAQ